MTATAKKYAQNVDQLASYLTARGIDKAGATGHLLGKVCEPAPGDEQFEGRLSIPYRTLSGVVGIKYRCVEDHDCKTVGCRRYDQHSQRAHLYNASVLADGGDVVAICEGELDALVCATVVGVPAVGTPGTSWLDHWSRCFADFDRVLCIADHDAKEDGSDPGVKHARKVQATISGAELVLPPAGEDLSSWVLRDGVDAVRERLMA